MMGGSVACTDSMCVYSILLANHDGKRTLRKGGYRWEDNIKMVV
jgi:hypothetical protein